MNVTVFSGADDKYMPIADVTWPRMRRWCKNMGYEFAPRVFSPGPNPTNWRKLDLFCFGPWDEDSVFVWMDADTFIVNETFNPLLPKDGVAFSSDSWGLAAGVFFAHGRWSEWFFEIVKWLGQADPQPPNFHVYADQGPMMLLHKNFESVRKHISLIPTSVISNPECPDIKPEFAFSYWAHHWQDIPAELAKIKI